LFHHIEGKVIDCSPGTVVIDAAGVGYEIAISLATYEAVRPREYALIYTRLSVRPDTLKLYGFHTMEERQLFDLLTQVKGLGPSGALSLLSGQATGELCRAIAAGDIAALKTIKGIGAKTAERIVVELREKVGDIAGAVDMDMRVRPGRDEAVDALVALEFAQRDAERIVAEVRKALGESAPVEEIIRHSLQRS